MKKSALTIGLLGATAIAEKAMILPARSSGLFTLRGVAASDVSRAQAFAARHPSMAVYENYAALLCDPEIDIAYISLHNSAHAAVALDAIHAGKHVIIEKPLCLGRREWHAMHLAAQARQVRVIEAIMCDEHPWQNSVATLITRKTLGELKSVHTTVSFTSSALRGYRIRPELGGGIFLDAASYWLQMLQATLPFEPVGIVGDSSFNGPNGIDDCFQAGITYTDGTRAELQCRFGETYQASHEWRFSRGTILLRDFLLPTKAAFPVNLHVIDAEGKREVITHAASHYYEHQLRRIAGYFASDATAWQAIERRQAQRVSLMEDIYRCALTRRHDA
ncbi:Gfo/Idh/MocA family protein [Dickeya dianthicola]|uniref:Gfo/Idh/MocA family protein n=1 Tax=Dickeya dianthicola TaxID=204039 RepID=UPI0018689EB6|nr:Gfo/Idh/MocA family oxidoreductase [Dickeya dianthicola]QOL15828.1 Gfo/Idh/MocA family oxidoreductase [Dickeya dianthicola]